MIEVTLEAALNLTARMRAVGVVGMPGVRVRASGEGTRADQFQLVIEDRPRPGDEVNESRGIRFYVDDRTASLLGQVTLDATGEDFVIRKRDPEAES